MVNPFENPDALYHVLTNGEGQHSLWPAFIPVPAGWTAAIRNESRTVCLEYIESHWKDMRPQSIREAACAPER